MCPTCRSPFTAAEIAHVDGRPQQSDSQGGDADNEAAITISGSSSTKVWVVHVRAWQLLHRHFLFFLLTNFAATFDSQLRWCVQLEAVVRRLLFLTRQDPGAKVTGWHRRCNLARELLRDSMDAQHQLGCTVECPAAGAGVFDVGGRAGARGTCAAEVCTHAQ